MHCFCFYIRPNRKFLESNDSSEEMTMSSTQRRQSLRTKNRTLVPELPSLPILPSPKKAPQTNVRKTISSFHSPQSNTMFDLCRSSNLGSSTGLLKHLSVKKNLTIFVFYQNYVHNCINDTSKMISILL